MLVACEYIREFLVLGWENFSAFNPHVYHNMNCMYPTAACIPHMSAWQCFGSFLLLYQILLYFIPKVDVVLCALEWVFIQQDFLYMMASMCVRMVNSAMTE